MDLNFGFTYIWKQIPPPPPASTLFSPPSPHFKDAFAIFLQGYFIMTPLVYENLEKYPTPPAYSTPYYK